MSELLQLPASEAEQVVRWLRAAVEYETITEAEAGAYYTAYLDILEEEHSPLINQ